MSDHWHSIVWYISFAFFMVAIVCAMLAVMKGRTPQGTIAWVGALLAFPIVSVPFFALFGAYRFAGYVRARRRGSSAISQTMQKAYTRMQPWRELGPGISRPMANELFDSLPATHANRTRLLIDGDATFAAIFEAIDSAQRYLLLQFFIVHDDRLGGQFRERIFAARARGVAVYFLFDGVGSHDLPRAYIRSLADAGVHIKEFRPTKAPRFRLQLNFRNHRKIVIADGRVAYIGGLNVGDEYLGQDPAIGPWRDTHLEIQGPAVQAVQMAFVEDWYCVTRHLPELEWTPTPVTDSRERVAIVATGPADSLESGVLMFMHLINIARDRLWITTPYFVPDEGVFTALRLASVRGVDVRVLIPEHPDHPVVHVAANSYSKDAITAGIRVFKYKKGFMHQKVVLSDDVAAVGSANFDNRSMRINFEITAVSDRGSLAADVAAMLEHDFKQCYELDAAYFAKETWGRRFLIQLSRLASPVL